MHYRPARLAICCLLFCCCVGPRSTILAQESRAKETEKSDAAEKMDEPPKSQMDLATRLLKLLKEEKFKSIRGLRVPPELLVELGLVKDGKQRREYKSYVKSVENTPELAKRYKAFLKGKGVLPVDEIHVKADSPTKFVHRNGSVLTNSVSVLLVDENGAVQVELIDRAVGIDGNWYILKLANSFALREMKEKQQSHP